MRRFTVDDVSARKLRRLFVFLSPVEKIAPVVLSSCQTEQISLTKTGKQNRSLPTVDGNVKACYHFSLVLLLCRLLNEMNNVLL